MNEVMSFLSQPKWHSALTAISTLFIALLAGVSAWLTRSLIQENKLLRKAGTEPRVVAYLAHHPYLWEFFNFVLANVGRGPARNVSFRILAADEGDFESHEVALKNSAERTPLGFLPQEEMYTAFFGSGVEIMGEPRLRPFQVEVSYENMEGKQLSELFELDVAQFEGFSSIGSHPDQDAADALKKMAERLNRLTSASGSRLKVETVTAEEVRQQTSRSMRNQRQQDQEPRS